MTNRDERTRGTARSGLRIGGRVILLAGLGVAGLVGLCGVYLVSDARIESATRQAEGLRGQVVRFLSEVRAA